MKPEFDFSDVFDCDGLISFVIILLIGYLGFYKYVYPQLLIQQSEDVSTFMNADWKIDNNQLPCDLSPIQRDIPETGKGAIRLDLEKPNFLSGITEATVNLVLTNRTQATQKGRIVLEESLKDANDNDPLIIRDGEPKIQAMINSVINGQSQNFIDYKVPSCSRVSYQIVLNSPKAPEINENSFAHLLFAGITNCEKDANCANKEYIRWSQNTSCLKYGAGLTEEVGAENICIPVDNKKAIQYSLRQNLLISPWANIFLVGMIFIVVCLVDRIIFGSTPKELFVSVDIKRVFLLLMISLIALVIIFLFLCYLDFFWAVIIVVSIMLLSLLFHSYIEGRVSSIGKWIKTTWEEKTRRSEKIRNIQDKWNRLFAKRPYEKRVNLVFSILSEISDKTNQSTSLRLIDSLELLASQLSGSREQDLQRDRDLLSLNLSISQNMTRTLSRMDSVMINRYISILIRIFPEDKLISHMYESIVSELVINAKSSDDIQKRNPYKSKRWIWMTRKNYARRNKINKGGK